MFIFNLIINIFAAHGFSRQVTVASRFHTVLRKNDIFINQQCEQFLHYLQTNEIEKIHMFLNNCNTVGAQSTKLCKVDLSIFEKTPITAIENSEQKSSIKTSLDNYKCLFDTNVRQIIIFMNIYLKLSKLDNIDSDIVEIIAEKHKNIRKTIEI